MFLVGVTLLLMSVKLKFNTVTTADTIEAELPTKEMHRRAADD